MAKPLIVCVVGTRPDAIKTAPVVMELRRYLDVANTIILATGQHREMLTQALDAFGLRADHDLEIMQHGQTLADVTVRALSGLDVFLAEVQPQLVLAQGDTTTTFVAGLASFYRQIPFGHIEAGLRTDSIWSPYPEEFNRRAVSLFAAHHFAPTQKAAQNLLKEGCDPEKIVVTGNTGIDAVKIVSQTATRRWFGDHEGRVALLTTHRRENWGEPQHRIASACRKLLEQHEDLILAVAMHRNPEVRRVLSEHLSDHPRARLIDPPEYVDFVKLMERSTLILTDSGGVQEEAPSLGRPVLVLRDTTERPEGIEAGAAKLVGTQEEEILTEASRLLDDPAAYAAMAQTTSPYGDGKAAARIRFQVLKALGSVTSEVEPWI